MPRYLVAAVLLLFLFVLLGTRAWFMLGPGDAPVSPGDPSEEAAPALDERGPRQRVRPERTEPAAPEPAPAPQPAGVVPPPLPGPFVRVRVVDASGAVVEGALAQVIALSTRLALEIEPQVRTGADGEARVRIWTEDGEFRVRVTRGDDLAMSEILFPPGEGDEVFVEVRLLPSITVRGRVVGPDGRATPSAAVTLRTSEVSTDSFDFGARADSNGQFTIGPLAAGEVAGGVTMTAFAGRGTAPHYEHVDAGRLRSGEVVLRVPVAVRAIGRVLSADGSPVEGVSVYRSDGFTTVTTDADGRFEFASVAADEPPVLILPAPEHASVAAPLARRGDTLLDAGDVALAPGRSLTVRVVDEDGSPALFATVLAGRGAMGLGRGGVCAGSGRATLHGLGPGPFDVSAEEGSFFLEPHLRSAPLRGVLRGVVPGDEEVEIVVRPGLCLRARLVDVVTRAALRPNRGRVRLRPQEAGDHGAVTSWPLPGDGTVPPGFPSDDDVLLLVAERPGLHELVVTAAGHHPEVVRDISIHEDRVTEIEVPLRAR